MEFTPFMTNVYWACGFVLACIGFYRFVLPRLRAFDRANVARIEREARDKADANAHIRHALEVADQQVEEIQPIQVGTLTHYLFEAQVFATREEAEEMRARRVGAVARRFYDELPAALMRQGDSAPRSPLSARERASQRWKRTIH
jgi:hypothetical protein